MHTGTTKIKGRYHAYTTLAIPIGRTPDEQHAHKPTARSLEAGQVYSLTYEGRTLELEIVRFVNHLVEFTLWEPYESGRMALGAAALPYRWVYHALDHRGAELDDTNFGPGAFITDEDRLVFGLVIRRGTMRAGNRGIPAYLVDIGDGCTTLIPCIQARGA